MDLTTVDTRGRAVKSVPEPIARRPTDEEFYLIDKYGTKQPNPRLLKAHFFGEGRLTEEQALFILYRATELLRKDPNVAQVSSPVTICGDIHGQYYDLMKIFEVGGDPTESTYLWLGDYVDRGNFGIECLLYLYSLKIWHPKTFTMLRGNHECRHLTEYFTFKRECLHKYSPVVYEACLESFCALPMAAIVDNRFFCVHGGLSPELLKISDLDKVDRFTEPGSTGMLCDLLWADPVPNFGYEQEPSATNAPIPPGTTFLPNPMRGCSYLYTYEAACQFLERNSLLGIIRGHEAQDAGYTMHKKTPTKKFPSVITIFSAPNYCDCYRNRGAVLKYANKNITIRQYNASAHPFWLPNFMDAFTWSLPFVGSKITEMLLAILSICSEEELAVEEEEAEEKDEDALPAEEVAARREAIKKKILALGKMQRIFQVLRDEAENASEMTSNEAFSAEPQNLTVQKPSIRTFADARRSDSVNERLPQFHPEDVSPVAGSSSATTMFPVPSMRRGTTMPDEPINMEAMIKRNIEHEGGGGGGGDRESMVEGIAERLASRRKTGKGKGLKRHDTSHI